jgi:molybdenum cofactor cytidylyltransferase
MNSKVNDQPRKMILGAVLLAAGPSTRLGRSKQLVRVGEESLVRKTARLLLGMNLDYVTVVCGCGAELVRAELEGLKLGIVYNRDWNQGMGSSINCGVRLMPQSVDGVLVMVCDQWRLNEQDLGSLINAWASNISAIHVACWDDGSAFISGPPVIFPRKLIPELKGMDPRRGARQLIDRYMDSVEFVKVQNAAFDLDRPEDLERLNAETQRSPSS